MRSTQKIAGIASLLTLFGLGTANAADPLVPPPAPAPNANTIQLKISGQVNKAVLYGDNDQDEEVFFVDNDNSGTRFRFVASGRLNDDITAGATIELQFESNSTTDIRFNANGGTGGTPLGGGANGVGERIGEVWFNSASMGKLSLGQGNTASNGTSEVDLSGTDIISYSGIADLAGGLGFANTNGVGTADDMRVGQVFTNLDGGSRRDRIRYDTPAFAGFRASTSASQGGRYDVALRYANQFAGARVAAAVAYQNTSAVSAVFDERINGSISVLLDNGFNATFAAGDEGFKAGGSRSFYYGKVGYQTNSISQYGMTSFSIDYFQGDDLGGNGSGDQETYAFAAVQNLDPVGAQIFLAVRNYEIDAANDDVLAIAVGSRIKF
jgi:hypothetical protein